MVQGKKLLLDFGTTLKDGKAQLLTEGKAHPNEAGSIKALREHGFPLALMEKGYTLDITKAEASREEDKRHIFDSICKAPLDSVRWLAFKNIYKLSLR